MNKKDIINYLKKYDFDSNEYIVISGAAMVILGIKEETNDIDIAVSKKYYNYLLNNYDCKFDKFNEYNHACYFIDNIINFGIDYYNKNKDFISGIPIQTKENLIKLKKSLNREKDILDLEKIKEFYEG